MSRSGALLHLQGIDLELDAHQARLQAIEKALGDDPAIRQAQRELVEAQAQLRSAHAVVQNLEFDSQNLAAKIAEVEGRTYSGLVKNPKELQDLQNEAASLKRRRGDLEEKQFDALVASEAAETRNADAQQRLKRAEAASAEAHRSLAEERTQLQATVTRLQANRDASLPSIPPGDLEVYARLRQSKKGRAVSQLDEGACTACGVAPSSSRIQDARQGAQLILCGNCGRILCAD